MTIKDDMREVAEQEPTIDRATRIALAEDLKVRQAAVGHALAFANNHPEMNWTECKALVTFFYEFLRVPFEPSALTAEGLDMEAPALPPVGSPAAPSPRARR